jgi:hypothetical protein
LDKSGLHDVHRRLEHRLGIPVRPCTGNRSVVPGVRNPCRGVSWWNSCGQRDGRIRSIGDNSIQLGSADAGG